MYTNLFTGQERREIPFSTHASATVEMANLNDEYDVVVIDEIQMISDVTRGAAWTKALLGMRCKEIHVCGGLEAKEIVKKIVKACGDDFEVNTYERFSKLEVAKKGLTNDPMKAGCYKQVSDILCNILELTFVGLLAEGCALVVSQVKPGDCIVAFSRNDIFAIKREIEKSTNYKCCVIYGKLPPTTRAEQARRFNDPDSGYDIIVASDAIGMGLNLNIKRLIFNSIFKFNGEAVIRLSHSEIKQISGRAGRRNSPHPNGEATCRDPRDLPYIRQCLTTEIEPIEKAALLPTAAHIELFSEALHAYDLGKEATDLHQILRQFSAMATVKGDYFLGRQSEMRMIAKRLKHIPIHLRDAYTMCLSPTTENSLALLENFAWKLAQGKVFGLPSRSVPKKAKSFDDLSYLCGIYSDADLFMWLQFKFPPSNAVEHQAALARKERTLEFINEALANTEKLKLNHCYIKQDTRHRTEWEAENALVDKNGSILDEQSEDDEDEYSDDEEAMY
jgi:ATP-dependent RNA helicase SUPV3L1/SUV3